MQIKPDIKKAIYFRFFKNSILALCTCLPIAVRAQDYSFGLEVGVGDRIQTMVNLYAHTKLVSNIHIYGGASLCNEKLEGGWETSTAIEDKKNQMYRYSYSADMYNFSLISGVWSDLPIFKIKETSINIHIQPELQLGLFPQSFVNVRIEIYILPENPSGYFSPVETVYKDADARKPASFLPAYRILGGLSYNYGRATIAIMYGYSSIDFFKSLRSAKLDGHYIQVPENKGIQSISIAWYGNIF